MYINQGYTSTEIANMIELPDELNKVWYTRQYYGTLKHNVKAVYQKYMGWYDENPIHLDELEPTEYSKKLVEYLGDTDKVLEMAKKDFDKGEYQWVAQITNTLVYADPEIKTPAIFAQTHSNSSDIRLKAVHGETLILQVLMSFVTVQKLSEFRRFRCNSSRYEYRNNVGLSRNLS